MGSIKVSELTEKTSPSGSEELLINDGGVSKKITIANLPDNDTTYSVGDGGLTEINFTSADNTKLDGIEDSANNYSHPASHSISFITGLQSALDGKTTESYVDTQITNLVGAAPEALNTLQELGDALGDDANFAGTITTALAGKVNNSQVLTDVPSGAVFTDTTYSVGDGGLTTNDFTDADHTKLNGIEAGATNVTNNNQLTNGAGYVTTDTNTTYSAGTGMSLSGTTFNCTIDTPSEVGLGSLYSNGNYLSGSFTASGNITAYSDVRLKSNIEVITDALSKVEGIRGVNFDMSGSRSTGVIAQELEEVLPEAVMTNEDGFKSVAYGNIVGLLIEAVKELSDKVKALENK